MATTAGITSVTVAAGAPEVEIRPVVTREEYEDCAELQRVTWGREYSDLVPVGMMGIAVRMGGICLGAFHPSGEMLGFVFGVTGLREGGLAHWSHMLAVKDKARNAGIGRRLKLAQRERAVQRGAVAVYWTFDPLVGRNAHFNVNRLGASVAEYVPDMYGASNSVLHRLGTDRFIARWDLGDDFDAVVGGRMEMVRRERRRVASPGGAGRAGPQCGAVPEASERIRDGSRPVMGMPGKRDVPPAGAGVVDVVVPRDIRAVETRCLDEALAWRSSNRRALMRLLGDGYSVAGFVPGREYGRYVMARSV